MTVFEEKLASLCATIRLAGNGPVAGLTAALLAGHARPAVAVGSGGSVVATDFFARCRMTLGHAFTTAMTPMEFVLSSQDWSDWDIWLFSAGSDNPDIAAAFERARMASCSVRLMTVNPHGTTARAVCDHGTSALFAVPVSDPKDGFLSTHSMVAMVTALLLASEALSERIDEDLLVRFDEAARTILTDRTVVSAVELFRQGDMIAIVHDPQCLTLARLVETSLWETGIAPVQRTDFRNFAHGRHVWAARHPERLFMLAMTATESRAIWTPIRSALPDAVRSGTIDLGHAGRLRSAASILEGLVMIDALGRRTGVDPGKPGRGEFAPAIYDDRALVKLAQASSPSGRHKKRAIDRHDDPACADEFLPDSERGWLDSLSQADIRALVMDYDGTIVTTEGRLLPPEPRLVAALVRLIDAGVKVGFATGRGGSAGEMLRTVFPARIHADVMMGYYNGGVIEPLSVDIRHAPPPPHPGIETVGDWIHHSGFLKPGAVLKQSSVQISIDHDDLSDPRGFANALRGHPALANGAIHLTASHHSFDLFPVGTSKALVIDRLRAATKGGVGLVLAIGDSGALSGNDHDLLSRQPSISVDSVCGDLAGSWSLFGDDAKGPDALLRIIEALRVENGVARLHIPTLSSEGSP